MFIPAFTRTQHLSLSEPKKYVQSMPPSYFPKVHFNIILPATPGSSNGVSFPQVSAPKPSMHLFSSPYVLHAPPVSFFSIWSPE